MTSRLKRPRKRPESEWAPWLIGAAVIIALAIFIAVYPINPR